MAELNHTLINIVGPTAIGKTALSIDLAKKFNCPILSTDSRQLYTEMTIGTAKPTNDELNQAEHFFINSRSVQDFYTAGMFEEDALRILQGVFFKHKVCISVGGSGLYINALAWGIDDIPSDADIRQKVISELEEKGLEFMQERLKEIDPQYHAEADIKNPRRVMRAIEVFEISGQPYSTFRKKSKKDRPFKMIWIGLEMELDQLYERINKRVDAMVENGLFDEVETLLPKQQLKALKTVGYQELFAYFNNEISRNEAIELVKRNSRRFARKQLAWFRKNPEIRWFHPSQTEEILHYIESNK